jgi:Hemerythrin HHE cation binding domain
MPTTRITGPLKTWYDLHEAISHEVRALATAAAGLDETAIGPFGRRFSWFAGELRTHSEVEDGIMFPAISAVGGRIEPGLHDEHLGEQAVVYDASCAILDATVRPTPEAFGRVADLVARLRDRLLPHLELEEEVVLPQVPVHFDDGAQAELLRTIIGSLPPDPRLQPWIAGALTPEHREARLRNMSQSLAPDVLAAVLRQIRDGVDSAVWADIRTRTPELARLVDDG